MNTNTSLLKQWLGIGVCLILALGLSSCGKSGDLYLPEDKPSKSASTL